MVCRSSRRVPSLSARTRPPARSGVWSLVLSIPFLSDEGITQCTKQSLSRLQRGVAWAGRATRCDSCVKIGAHIAGSVVEEKEDARGERGLTRRARRRIEKGSITSKVIIPHIPLMLVRHRQQQGRRPVACADRRASERRAPVHPPGCSSSSGSSTRRTAQGCAVHETHLGVLELTCCLAQDGGD